MRVKVSTKTSRSEVSMRLFNRCKEGSATKVGTKRVATHIIRVKCLSVRRILQEHPLKSKDFADGAFGQRRKVINLKFVYFVVTYNFLQDSIELVQHLYPCVQVGSGPLPDGDVAENVDEVIIGSCH